MPVRGRLAPAKPANSIVAIRAGVFWGALVFLSANLTNAAPGDLDPTFAGMGKIQFGFGVGFDVVSDAVMADEKIIVVGQSSVDSDGVFVVARYLMDGSPDPSFGGNGVVLTNIVPFGFGIGGRDAAAAVALQADGKIVVAGSSQIGSDQDFALLRYFPDGTLDASFGVGGVVRTDFGGVADMAWAMAGQADGGLIVAGTTGGDLAVARYNADGSLDSSFGTEGKVTLSLAATFGSLQPPGLTLQADGKIVLGSSPDPGQGTAAFLLFRLNANGALDSSFGSGGLAVIPIASGVCTAVAMQPGNNVTGNPPDTIVAAGTSFDGVRTVFTALRFNLDGSLDPSFGSGGVQTTDVGGVPGTASCQAVVVEGSGLAPRKIVLAGGVVVLSGSEPQMALVRYTSSGALDATFDGDGIAFTPLAGFANTLISGSAGTLIAAGATSPDPAFALARFGSNGLLDPTFDQDGFRTDEISSSRTAAKSVAFQADGRIVVVGSGSSLSDLLAVARLEPDGSFDLSFDGDGRVGTDFDTTRLTAGRAVALQPDGKILVAAGASPAGSEDFAIVRLNPNGSFDSSFDTDGIATTAMGGATDSARALALQTDGKVVVAGFFFNGSNNDVAIARYNPNGALDSTFDFDGRVFLSFGDAVGNDEAHAVAVQPDGKIVIGGFSVIGVKQFFLARLNPNGSVDESFGQRGAVRTTVGTGDAEVNALALYPNGDIAAAGCALNGAEVDFAVARYHADGSLDLSFDDDGIAVASAGNGPEASGGNAVALQANGKIVVAGRVQRDFDNVPSKFAVLRLNADGSPDGSFGSAGQRLVPFGLEVDSDFATAVALDSSGRIVVAGQAGGLFGVVRLEGDPIPRTTLANISTRLRVETGDNVLIGGFIITGSTPKSVLVRAIGPSLPLAGSLADPILELHESAGALLASNDNWMDSPNKQEIIATTIPPPDDLESAILATLDPGLYTAIMRGVNNTTGIGLVEAYDLDRTVDSKLANISTRGLVQTGDDVIIGGFILLGTDAQEVLIRAIGPSLPVPGKLADPTLALHDKNGTTIASNDNWRSDQEAEIIATTIPPTEDAESAILMTLTPAAYTAIVRGKDNSIGVALVEAYQLN